MLIWFVSLSCSETNPGPMAPEVESPEPSERRVTVSLDLPTGNVDTNEIQLQAGIHDAALGSGLTGVANVRRDGAQIVQARAGEGPLLLMGVAVPGQEEVRLDPTVTAITLVFLGPGIASTDPVLAEARMSAIAAQPETATLAELIRDRLERGETGFMINEGDQEFIDAGLAAYRAALDATGLGARISADYVLASKENKGGIEVTEVDRGAGGSEITLSNTANRWIALVVGYSLDGSAFEVPSDENGPVFFPRHLIPAKSSASVTLLDGSPVARISALGIGSDFQNLVGTDPALDYSAVPIALSTIFDLLIPSVELVLGFETALSNTEGIVEGGCLDTWIRGMISGPGGGLFTANLLHEMALEKDFAGMVWVTGKRALSVLGDSPGIIVCLASESAKSVALSVASRIVLPLRVTLLAFDILEVADGLATVAVSRVQTDFMFFDPSLASIAPTIQSPVHEVLSINDGTSCPGSNFDPPAGVPGTVRRIAFDFEDLDGDAVGPNSRVSLSYLFSDGTTGNLPDVSFVTEGSSIRGTITIHLCTLWGGSSSVEDRIVLTDNAGNDSNTLTLRTSRPVGANNLVPTLLSSPASVATHPSSSGVD